MDFAVDLILLAAACTHVLVSPYTKVEESFNLHATHDVFFYGVSPSALKNYDHFIFPGAVPRSFIGSVLLGWMTRPFVAILSSLGLFRSKFDIQITLRLLLASLNALTLTRVRRVVSKRFGRNTGIIFGVLCFSQFHLPFWMGRTLPNMFALIPFNEALVRLIRPRNSPDISIALLAFAAIVFRSELAVYLAALSLSLLARRKISFGRLLAVGISSCAVSVLATVLVDSYFWQKWPMWPELQATHFNVVQGKSADWGTSPFHVYWTQHLPKLLTGAFPFALLGLILERQARTLALPSIAFVSVISAVGHKEWRFVVYVVPVFNIAAACALTWLLKQRPIKTLARLILLGTIGGSILITVLLTLISHSNYPGGEALFKANHILQSDVNLHICNLAAQTGASLFLQEHTLPTLRHNQSLSIDSKLEWRYDKTENLSDLRQYSHAIVEDLSLVDGWKIEEAIQGYSGLSKRGIVYSPKLWIASNPHPP